MNKLILCEGKTDAILLSYYLSHVQNWMPYKKGPIKISVDEASGESAYWYKREDDYLLICGVGGKDKFGRFFVEKKIREAIIDSNFCSKVALVTDRDDRQVEQIAEEICHSFAPVITQVDQNIWTENSYQDSYGQQQTLSFLLLVIPLEQQGALETVLLKAISEDPYDQKSVERCATFVEEMVPYADRYIGKTRLKLKAHLGVTWAIQSSGKEFTFIDQQIRSVPWERSDILAQCFSQLVLI